MAKTGSSSIQRYLAKNRRSLFDQGIIYPKTLGNKNHMKLAAYALNDDKNPPVKRICGIYNSTELIEFRSKLEQDLIEEIERSSCNTIILSNEHCDCLLEQEEVDRLHKLINKISNNITVIFYVRRQDSFLEAMYSTKIKNGSTEKFKIPTDIRRYDYYSLACRYEKTFGKNSLTIRTYDRDTLKDNDIVSDFSEIIGYNHTQLKNEPSDANQRLDQTCLEFLRELNNYLPRMTPKKGICPNRGNIVQLLEEVSTKKKVSFQSKELEQFYLLFEESNKKLATKFINPKNKILFPERSLKNDYKNNQNINQKETFQIFAKIWAKKETQTRKLKREKEKLSKELNKIRSTNSTKKIIIKNKKYRSIIYIFILYILAFIILKKFI